ncbi:MAG: NAD-dependent epimerase/dehydratase family protein [Acidimicrobiia bacterium]
MRALVTGATGTIGQAMALHAPDGVDLWTTSRSPASGSQHRMAELAEGQAANDIIAEVSPDVVIHLAGGVNINSFSMRASNVATTRQLLDAVTTSCRVVIVGSAAEYGEPVSQPISEDAPLTPVTEYGKVKAEQSTLAVEMAAARQLDVIVARPFNVVSRSMASSTALGRVAQHVSTVARGSRTSITVGRTDVVRDFVPVSFVADALWSLSRIDSAHSTFNVCSGAGVTLRSVFESMAVACGVTLDLHVDDQLAAMPAADIVVGNPTRLIEATGLRWKASSDRIAAEALGR